jgi:hypothetical protein
LTSTEVAAPKHCAVWAYKYEVVAHLARATFGGFKRLLQQELLDRFDRFLEG